MKIFITNHHGVRLKSIGGQSLKLLRGLTTSYTKTCFDYFFRCLHGVSRGLTADTMTFAPAIPSPKPYGGAITLSYIIQNIHYQALRWTLTAPSPLHQCSKSIKKPLPITTVSYNRRAAAHLLKSWVRIPPWAWIFVCCECRVLSEVSATR